MRLASRGLRDLDGGEEAVGDARERAALRRQARKVYLETVLVAVVGTVLVYAI